MSQRIFVNTLLSVAMTGITGFSTAAFADALSIGDATTNWGKVELSGWLRANYQDKDYSTNDHKLKFDAAKIALKYDAKHMFGAIEYRCYQSDTMCDLSTLVNANLGYKFNADSRVTVGLQDMPFGPSRAWSGSWYGSGLDNAGLDDVHNLGVNFQHQLSDTTKLDFAYFVRDGGSFAGSGGDTARFTANYVEPTDGISDHLKEKNMWVARVKQDIPLNQSDLKLSVGGSYWRSDIENKTNRQTGQRDAWNVFSQMSYQAANLTLIAGQNRVDNQSSITPDYSTVGSFNSEYYVANKANYYVADFNYRFKDIVDGYDLSPYWTYTIIDKDKSNFATSTRNVLGLQLDVKQLSFAAEYVIGKNDVFIGGDANSLVAGDSAGHSQLLNLLFMYNF